MAFDAFFEVAECIIAIAKMAKGASAIILSGCQVHLLQRAQLLLCNIKRRRKIPYFVLYNGM